MCHWGDVVVMRVPIPSHLSHTGHERWDEKQIDACVAPLVQELLDVGIMTSNSCCGHDNGPGGIILHDGQELSLAEARLLAKKKAGEGMSPSPAN